MGCEIWEAVSIVYLLVKTKGNSAKVLWVMDEGDSLLAATDDTDSITA